MDKDREAERHWRGWATVLPVLIFLSVSGCAPVGRYFARRGMDLADCVEASAGVGLLTYARAKVTDFAVVGGGFGQASRYGWRGRYLGGPGRPHGAIESEFGFPLLMNEEADEFPENCKVSTIGPCFTTRTYAEEFEPSPGGKFAQRFWIGAAATALLSARVGVNPVEMIDFVTGVFGVDLLGDDDWQPKPSESWKDKPRP